MLALPGTVSRLAIPCQDVLNKCIIAPEQVVPLAKLGITPQALALTVVAVSCLALLLASAVSAVLVWRRSDDWMALLIALTLILTPFAFTPVGEGLTGVWQGIGKGISNAAFITLFLLIGLFPSGRFVPRWLWLPVLVLLIGVLVPFGGYVPDEFGLVVPVSVFVCLIAGQIYRYRRISTPVQRQQTSWAVFGIILFLVLNQLFWQSYGWIPALHNPNSLFSLLFVPDSLVMICILAVSFGVAILRYRLYDIDVLINRTLVYGSLTVILALIYVAGVVGLQAAVNGVTSSAGSASSPLVIVMTTLAIAALFGPLRHRLQATIDRRFYRRKYDARKTLEHFGATLRQEVDLPSLTQHLVAVVEETMQPRHVSLWLCPTVMREESSRPLADR